MMYGRRLLGLATVLVLLVYVASAWCQSTPIVVDADAAGTRFNPGVRGMALADLTMDLSRYYYAIPGSLAVVGGSALRGVAGGLYADMYDWRVRNHQPRPPTLEFLRYARDHESNLFITANMRGLVEPDPASPGKFRYYTTDVVTLAGLARDWVYYVNRIVPRYRQGDLVIDPRDGAILDSLRWSSNLHPNDHFDTLPAPGEARVPRVTYWEIGNEPTISTGGSIGVTNGYTLSATGYRDRYRTIAAAMKDADPSIKVGPCLVGDARDAAHLAAVLSDTSISVDFVAYHPYGSMHTKTTAEELESYLNGIYNDQHGRVQTIRNRITAAGRDPARIELVASETNISNYRSDDTEAEARMAHALGSVEAIFTYARSDLTAAHYWIWAANQWDGTQYPSTRAFAMLRDHMGSRLLHVHSDRNFRLYATTDTSRRKLAVWMLNFSNSEDKSIVLSLRNLRSTIKSVALESLADRSGVTSLFSSNLASYFNGGPTDHVIRSSTKSTGTNLDPLALTVKAATLNVLVISFEATKADSAWIYSN